MPLVTKAQVKAARHVQCKDWPDARIDQQWTHADPIELSDLIDVYLVAPPSELHDRAYIVGQLMPPALRARVNVLRMVNPRGYLERCKVLLAE